MIIDKIKSLNHLTVQEKYLVDYILENPRHIFKKNINEIAKESYTSVATVSRLCKKLGFRGYTDFKFEYVSEYKNLLELFNDFKIEPFSIDTSLDETLNKVELLHKRSIEYTKSFLIKEFREYKNIHARMSIY